MTTRAERSYLAELIKQVDDKYGDKATSLPQVRAAAAKEALFLIVCILPSGEFYYSLHTREEMGFAGGKIPGGFFHRGDRSVNLHILTQQHRDFNHLRELNWI